MIKEILQIPIAVTLLLILIFVLLRYVKPRRSQAEFIIDLWNKLIEKNVSKEKDICNKKRKY